jgi:hypothetical protein
MKLEARQAELLVKYCENDTKMTMSVGRQLGKSNWQQLFRSFMERPEKRFQLASGPQDTQNYLLMIVDYMWWSDHEHEIHDWMEENLSGGIDHQQGMVIRFDTDQQRMMFLLRWA